MILTLNECENDRDCPELYDAFNATPIDLSEITISNGPKDALDAEIEMMRLDFNTLAEEWDLPVSTVWDMWEDGQFTWEPA